MPRVSADWIVPVVAPPVQGGLLVLDQDGRIQSIETGRAERHIRGVILPALVNAHVHLELSALHRRAPGGIGFLPWVIHMLAERKELGRDALRVGIPAGVAEAVRYGTGAVGEVTNTLDAVPAIGAAGLRGVIFHELLEKDDVEFGDALAHARQQRAAVQPWPSTLSYSVSPHAPYSCSESFLHRTMTATPGVPQTIHAAEDTEELALLRDGSGAWPRILSSFGVWERGDWVSGLSPVTHLDAAGFLERRPPPLLVHMVHATRREIQLAVARDATIVLCPRSNLHIGGKLPDVPAMAAAGARCALGTDSLSSNETLSIWSEMAALARSFPDLAAETIVRWATRGGAEALGLPEMGGLAPGFRPGVIALEGQTDDPHSFLVTAEPEEVTWLSRAS